MNPLSWAKLIAKTENSDYAGGLFGIFLDLLPQAGHMYVYRSGKCLHAVPPNLFKNLAP